MKQQLIERLLYVTLALVFVIASVSAIFAVQAINKFTDQQKVLQEQVAGQKEVLKGVQELLAHQGETTSDINKSLSCILIFFSTPDRAYYYISDLTSCTLTSTATGQTKTLSVPSSVVAPSTPKPPGTTNAPRSQPATPPTTPSAPTNIPKPVVTPKPVVVPPRAITPTLQSLPIIGPLFKLLGIGGLGLWQYK